MYIDNLEDFFEEVGCVDPIQFGIDIILLLYVDDIVLIMRSPCDFQKELRFLKDLYSDKGMIVNNDKTKFMTIKSKNITYDTFLYDNNNLEEVTS
jgi:hypothetical protein